MTFKVMRVPDHNLLSSSFSLCFFILAIALLFIVKADKAPAFQLDFSDEKLATAREKHGNDAVERLLRWQNLITSSQKLDEFSKIMEANYFINSVPFAGDDDHWGVEDYWSTPFEFIAGNGGDCEDYAIAKYFTLRAMGLEKAHLHIAYINVTDIKDHHMVLLYFPTGNSPPYVLDNLSEKILRLVERKEYELVYSANEDNVWGLTEKGGYIRVGDAAMVHKWMDIIDKVTAWKLPRL